MDEKEELIYLLNGISIDANQMIKAIMRGDQATELSNVSQIKEKFEKVNELF